MASPQRAIPSIAAVAGGICISVGAFAPWLSGIGDDQTSNDVLAPRYTPISNLFHGIGATTDSPIRSVALLLLVFGIVLVIGGVMASRLIMAIGMVMSGVIAALWVSLEFNHIGAVSFDVHDIRSGLWLTGIGLLLAVVALPIVRVPVSDSPYVTMV
jgi:hypothetical protein